MRAEVTRAQKCHNETLVETSPKYAYICTPHKHTQTPHTHTQSTHTPHSHTPQTHTDAIHSHAEYTHTTLTYPTNTHRHHTRTHITHCTHTHHIHTLTQPHTHTHTHMSNCWSVLPLWKTACTTSQNLRSKWPIMPSPGLCESCLPSSYGAVLKMRTGLETQDPNVHLSPSLDSPGEWTPVHLF